MSISAPENAADVAVAAAAERQRRTGVLTGMASYALWGLFPLYFHALSPTTPVEILAHRVVWSFLGMMGLLTLRREWGWIAELRRDRARLGRIWLAGVLLAINWLVYVWAVTADRVIDASLGYFVNPLVTVAMGVVLLGEHIRRGQAIALGLGGVAVVVLAVGYGEVPWVALVLALSFGGYGFLKKQVALEPVASLAAETTIVFPAALVWLGWQIGSGHATFGHHGTLPRREAARARHRHRRAAPALRCRDPPHPPRAHRAPAVHHAVGAVPAGLAAFRREDAAGTIRRVRPDLGGPRGAGHRRLAHRPRLTRAAAPSRLPNWADPPTERVGGSAQFVEVATRGMRVEFADGTPVRHTPRPGRRSW
jgi:RarD protein